MAWQPFVILLVARCSISISTIILNRAAVVLFRVLWSPVCAPNSVMYYAACLSLLTFRLTVAKWDRSLVTSEWHTIGCTLLWFLKRHCSTWHWVSDSVVNGEMVYETKLTSDKDGTRETWKKMRRSSAEIWCFIFDKHTNHIHHFNSNPLVTKRG